MHAASYVSLASSKSSKHGSRDVNALVFAQNLKNTIESGSAKSWTGHWILDSVSNCASRPPLYFVCDSDTS